MDCCKCPCMRQLIKRIISETPIPAPTPEPRTTPQLTGIQMQLGGYPVALFDDGEIVDFDTTISTSPNITYNGGNFTLLKAGTYLVNWQIATAGAEYLTNLFFGITLNGAVIASVTTPIVEGQVSGSVIVNAMQNDVIALKNTTGDGVQFKQANITILGVL